MPASSQRDDKVVNVADLVRRAATTAPTGGLRSGQRLVTWPELDHVVDSAAAGLAALGLLAGDRLGIVLPSGIEFATAYFAALRAGLVAVPISSSYAVAELRALLRDAAVRGLVCGPAEAARLAPVLAELPVGERVIIAGAGTVPVGALSLDDVAASPPTPALPSRGAEDLALLMYTSGATASPKGAMLSHRALLANLAQIARITPPPISAADRVLLALPLSHVYGLNVGLGAAAWCGATVVLAAADDPAELGALVSRLAVSVIVGAPDLYVAWADDLAASQTLRGVRLAVSGAAPLPGPVQQRLRETAGLVVHEGYGLTEAAPLLTTTLRSRFPKPGSIGRPVPGVEVRLVDEAGGPVEDGDPGELVVRGANLFSGYWPDGRGGPDADGWLATGDVGYVDDDGDLFLVDRRRELILVSGFNVYPREVEDVLLTHPGVAEVAVLGVPDGRTGESVKAYVRRRPAVQLSERDLIEYAARRLARFKCPTSVEFVETLPHSAVGKVAKGRLRTGGGS